MLGKIEEWLVQPAGINSGPAPAWVAMPTGEEAGAGGTGNRPSPSFIAIPFQRTPDFFEM